MTHIALNEVEQARIEDGRHVYNRVGDHEVTVHPPGCGCPEAADP